MQRVAAAGKAIRESPVPKASVMYRPCMQSPEPKQTWPVQEAVRKILTMQAFERRYQTTKAPHCGAFSYFQPTDSNGGPPSIEMSIHLTEFKRL